MKKLKISQLAPGIRYLQTLALKCYNWLNAITKLLVIVKRSSPPPTVDQQMTDRLPTCYQEISLQVLLYLTLKYVSLCLAAGEDFQNTLCPAVKQLSDLRFLLCYLCLGG